MFSKMFRDKRSYLRSSAFIHILLISLVSFTILGCIIYRTISENVIEQCKSNAMDIAKVASAEIDGDTFDSISSNDDEEYAELFSLLLKYTDADAVKYIYTMKMEGDRLIFVVDADTEEDRASYGEEYELLSSMKPALNGQICCDDEPTSDQWGSYISAYAPVFKSDGTTVGFVGVDTEMSSIQHELNVLKMHIIFLIAIFMSVCMLILFNMLSSMSRRDMLTGVMNYDSLVEKGNVLSKKGQLSGYTVIQLNIRNFKYINSRIGTSLGDVLLVQYAGIISGYLDSGEHCARTGSDNFILLVKKGHDDDLIEKLSETWINLNSYGVEETLQIPVRCGVYEITEKDSMQDAVNYTSVALNYSRTSNKNFITKFEPEMLESMVTSSKIVADFRRALEAKEFQVYYQPKVDVASSSLCGAEALVRWVKDGEVIPPAKFISVLENEGLITELDFFVFETVCRNICAWEDKGIKPVTISSNFSKLHLANPNFADSVLTIISKYSISPDFLEIELTESSGYSNYDALTVFVEKMNKAKIHTSIDDFGTGYSSLSMLKDINVDVVKIDKSFLAETDTDDAHREKMLENVIRMINDLDRTVVCEGIETENQLEFLRRASCSVVQGYFFDKPLPHDEFEKRLINPHYGTKNKQ